MIGRLRGTLLEKTPPSVLIEVHGVSYEVDAPMFTFYRLPDIGQEVMLYTHLVTREDAQILYGFLCEQERLLFRSLIKVSSIGPKMALAILSGIEPDAFVHCVLSNDTATLTRIPGIGKKTAERLVIEMRDRLTDWNANAKLMPAPDMIATIGNKTVQEAVSALVALGYKPQEASLAVSHINEHENMAIEELIRHALKSFMKE